MAGNPSDWSPAAAWSRATKAEDTSSESSHSAALKDLWADNRRWGSLDPFHTANAMRASEILGIKVPKDELKLRMPMANYDRTMKEYDELVKFERALLSRGESTAKAKTWHETNKELSTKAYERALQRMTKPSPEPRTPAAAKAAPPTQTMGPPPPKRNIRAPARIALTAEPPGVSRQM